MKFQKKAAVLGSNCHRHIRLLLFESGGGPRSNFDIRAAGRAFTRRSWWRHLADSGRGLHVGLSCDRVR